MVVIAAMVGCGDPDKPDLVTATGRVTYNGQPVTAGSVKLYPMPGVTYKGDAPGGVLQLDGSFTVKTYPWGDGVPPGSYRLTLDPKLATRIGKPEYADPATSPWIMDIPEGGVDDQPFEVK